MTGLLIAITCLGIVLVAEVAAACYWIMKELLWLRAVLVPWMVSIHKLIEGKQ